MSAPDWPRIRAVFDAMLDADPRDRAARLDSIDETPEVLAAVRALLGAHDADAAFLEQPAVLAHSPLDPGARFGPYRVERVLGEGGMGVVYLATHEDGGLRRPMALKVARTTIGGLAERAYASAERDILSLLAHPNIAYLYDAGVTADGQSYLVMEYVDGVPITSHARTRALTDRLALVCAACDAVDYAHRRLVIHRDLKPANVLVTRDGQVKLLDFGIAKRVRTDEHDATNAPPTLAAHTPAYAAPEQLRGDRVTTAVDVYALGVIAYELVAGQRPYQTEGLTPAQHERLVSTTTPAPPSPRQARRARATDIDTVILKAIRAEPEERYASPGAFADDLRRALSGRPVAARPPTARYLMGRFVRRHRTGVVVSAAAMLLLVATASVAVVQARRAREQAKLAMAERSRASAAAQRAERINAFLQSVLATSNPSWYVPGEEKGPDVTVLRALQLAATRMEEELADDPETRADIHHTLGDTYRVLGDPERMRTQFDRALALRRQRFTPPHPKLADAMFYAAVGRMTAGAWDEATTLAQEALVMQQQRDEGNNLPYLYETVAALANRVGDFALADSLQRAGLAVARERYAEQHPLVQSLKWHHVYTLTMRGQVGAARRLAQQAGRADSAPFLLQPRAWLAVADGDLVAADSLFRRAAEASPGGPAGTAFVQVAHVATVLIPRRQWRDARALLQQHARAIASLQQRDLSILPSVAEGLALGAAVAVGEGRLCEAATRAREAIALIDRASTGLRHDPFWEARAIARGVLLIATTDAARGAATVASPPAMSAGPLQRAVLGTLAQLPRATRRATANETVCGADRPIGGPRGP